GGVPRRPGRVGLLAQHPRPLQLLRLRRPLSAGPGRTGRGQSRRPGAGRAPRPRPHRGGRVTPADADVRETITRRGLGRTLFVEAGAGTGKTTQLVERIANLVIDEGVPLAGIAAITFTEAAAAELAARIRERFERRAADSADGEVQARCRAAIADADRAAVSTLH